MKLTTREITVFAMLGAIMYVSKIIMDLAPNIHLLGMFIVAYTIVYRAKALYPIYVFVFITGLFGGFATWWIPYLYIWTILWGITMLFPKRMPRRVFFPSSRMKNHSSSVKFSQISISHSLPHDTRKLPSSRSLKKTA